MELQLHRNLGGGSEHRFYIELLSHLTPEKEAILRWCLAETYDQDGLSPNSFLAECRDVLETGPNLRTTTPWSTTALDIFKACGLTEIGRIEFTRRIGIDTPMTEEERATMLATLYDRMTEMPYDDFRGFPEPETPKPVKIVPVLEHGMDAIVQINDELGLGMEPQDINFCKWLFTELLKRDPTDVEMFQIGQANSEHCRHKRFRGQYTIDGVLQPRSMWDVVKGIYHANIGNSVLGLCDNSSALRGRQMSVIIPITAGIASQLHKIERLIHYILTVETHNFPTGIAPYPGAATGQGGMQRDLLGTGRGADMLMAGAGYIVDHLNDPKHPLSWEMDGWVHPPELASSLQIINEASLGGSDYLNCIGVPGTFGYCRSFALTLPDGSRRGKYKPTMTAMGCGTIDDENLIKGEPEVGLLALQLGGPALRVGLGGGAASSMSQGDNSAELDFNAVQRDDPYMEQLVWRVIRACIELGQKNPIVLIHDLGAGGSLNALTEALLPKGGRIDLRKLPVGDKSLSTLEIWGNEAQERMAILIRPEDLQFFMDICTREKAPCAVVGEVTGDGWIELFDSEDGSSPVHLPLREILDNLPQQSFSDKSVPMHLEPMRLPANTTIKELLSNVMRHLSVCSKRFLTEIADSSVGGCIISQQTVGPNSIPLADFALAAPSFDDPYGVAVAVGEQPVKGLISPEALARLGIAEALMNLVGAGITSIKDVKFSANWMWPAKEPGEAAKIFAALLTTETFMHYLRVAIDGGKDSLSMVVKNVENPFGRKQHVLSPGDCLATPFFS